MKIGIMQPYFFPYLGYFSLIKNTDFFIFFDTPQYIRKGWINRNRILNTDGKDVYMTIPVEKQPRETPINEIKIVNNCEWKRKIEGQLTAYKKKAPHYNSVVDLVKTVIYSDYNSISEIAIASIIETCKYLNLDLKYDIFSKMDMGDIEVSAPDEWALEITKKMGYDTYVNPPGGKAFFSKKKYDEEKIELQFLTQNIIKYNQKNCEFIPNLSILDVLMFCEPPKVIDFMSDILLE